MNITLSEKLSEKLERINLRDTSSILIHLFRKDYFNKCTTPDLCTIFERPDLQDCQDIINILVSKENKENIVHIQFQNLCMEIKNTGKRVFSQKRTFVGYESGILMEIVQRDDIDILCFPNLKNYPIHKNIVRYEDIIIKDMSSTIVIEKNSNNIEDIFICITDKNELNRESIRKMLSAINKKIAKNKK